MRTEKRDIVGAFIFSKDDKLLLGYAGVYAGQLCVPGGGIEDKEGKKEKETPHEAIIREIREETGIDITQCEVTYLKGQNTGRSRKKKRDTGEEIISEMTFFDYRVDVPLLADEIELVLEDDFTNAGWYPVDQLDQLSLAHGTRTRLTQMGYISQSHE